jgi:hypothetical protein
LSVKKQNNEPGITNLILNITIFVLSAIVIYLLFILFTNVTGKKTVPEEKAQKAHYKPTGIIQAEVLNGCGISGLADIFKDYLRAKKIDVVSTGNYQNFDVLNSFIIDRIGDKEKALYVAELLGIKKENVITRINRDYFLDMSIVIGKDYLKLKPLR